MKVWDVGGAKMLRALWISFYRNIDFTGIIYVVNICKDAPTNKKGLRPIDQLAKGGGGRSYKKNNDKKR